MSAATVTYDVDEAGDGVLFGPQGRDRLQDEDAPQFFMLGMVRCPDEAGVAGPLGELRAALQKNPLYATIHSLRPQEQKTARAFHAKDDHAEIRSKVFELLVTLDFKFYAVVKDMRAVRDYVERRNRMDSTYRYHPNELYDLTVRMLFRQRLHKEDHYPLGLRPTRPFGSHNGAGKGAGADAAGIFEAAQIDFKSHAGNPASVSVGTTVHAGCGLLLVGAATLLRKA
jgi:hypothetical protein